MDKRSTTVNVELTQNRRHMVLHGARTQMQLSRNLRVGEAHGDESRNLALSLREVIEVEFVSSSRYERLCCYLSSPGPVACKPRVQPW